MAGQPLDSRDRSGSSPDVRSYLAIARQYAWFTVLVVAVALGATYFLTQRQQEVYSTSSRVMLRTSATVSLFPFAATGPNELLRAPTTELLYVQSPAFRTPLGELTPGGISVSASSNGSDLIFTARGASADDTAVAANLWAESYIFERQIALDTAAQVDMEFIDDTIADLERQRDEIREEVIALDEFLAEVEDPGVAAQIVAQKVSVESLLQPQLAPIVQEITQYEAQLAALRGVTRFVGPDDISARIAVSAGVPSSPVSPNLFRNLAVGGLLGLALGVTLPYLRHALNDRVNDRREVAHSSGLPVLGTVPSFKQDETSKIEVLHRPGSAASEHYQGLLTAIDFASIGDPITSLLITSAAPGDGKTTTAVNIAALASRYMNVMLIDADMRRPNVHELIDTQNRVGLSDVLAGRVDFNEARITVETELTRFDVLQAGPAVKEPALLLRGEAWSDLLSEMFLYDLIVVDGPPVLAVTDPLLLGRAVDGQVLVSSAGKTTNAELIDASALLDTNGSRSLGVVVNREKASRSQYSYYGSYSSEGADASPEGVDVDENARPPERKAGTDSLDPELEKDRLTKRAASKKAASKKEASKKTESKTRATTSESDPSKSGAS